MREILIIETDKPPSIDPGPAPMLEWIDIRRLVVDDTYQRELKPKNWKAVRSIAADFKWSRFSPVFCAPIEGGRFAIIDGQHRTHAAAMCGFEKVPCQIVQMSREEQAEAFSAVNGNVTKVTSWQILKAAVVAGEPWAAEASACAEQAGAKLVTSTPSYKLRKPGSIYSPNMFRKVIEDYGKEKVTSALRIILAAEGYRDVAEVWDGPILEPMLRALCETPKLLERSNAHVVLEQFDIWKAIEDIQAETKRKIRLALPYQSKKVQLKNALLSAFDAKEGAA